MKYAQSILVFTLVALFFLSISFLTGLMVGQFSKSISNKQIDEVMKTNTELNRNLITANAEIYDLKETIKELENNLR